MVEWQLGRGGVWQWLAIEAVLENRVDRAVGTGANLEAAFARCLEALDAIVASEPQDAETASKRHRARSSECCPRFSSAFAASRTPLCVRPKMPNWCGIVINGASRGGVHY